MIGLSYLGVLIFSFVGMTIVDWRYKLALFYDKKRTASAVLLGVIVFSVWDVLGISLGVFFSGKSQYMSGWYVVTDFPIEELVFLTFLCYFTLVVYRFLETRWQHI